jgi:hypothetical protein
VSDLITVTEPGVTLLSPETFKLTRRIEATLFNEEIQDAISLYGEDQACMMIGKQIFEQLKKAASTK